MATALPRSPADNYAFGARRTVERGGKLKATLSDVYVGSEITLVSGHHLRAFAGANKQEKPHGKLVDSSVRMARTRNPATSLGAVGLALFAALMVAGSSSASLDCQWLSRTSLIEAIITFGAAVTSSSR